MNNNILPTGPPPSPTVYDQTQPSYRILVVDDDMAICELCTDALIPRGYLVDTAQDGDAAWEALRGCKYDLLITDNRMPKVTGMELVKMLRSARMTLPVVLASSATPIGDQPGNSALQLSALLLKPFTVDELLQTVKQVLPNKSWSQRRGNYSRTGIVSGLSEGPSRLNRKE